MANKMKEQKMNRMKLSSSLSANLNEDRLKILEVEGANDVNNMDLTYSSYEFNAEEKQEAKPQIVEEHDDIDSLVEYIKNVDAAFVKEKKVANHSVADKIIAENKDKPKMKRNEIHFDYSNEEKFDINSINGDLSSIDYYLGALKEVKNNNENN